MKHVEVLLTLIVIVCIGLTHASASSDYDDATLTVCYVKQNYELCIHTVCTDIPPPQTENGPALVSKRVSPNREDRYYVSNCSYVNLKILTEEVFQALG